MRYILFLLTAIALPMSASANDQETCGDSAQLKLQDVIVSSGVWNRDVIKDGNQCITSTPGWNWDWPSNEQTLNRCEHVVSYPSIIYGRRPWDSNSTTPELPRQISNIKNMLIDVEVETKAEGKYNTAFDIWIVKGQSSSLMTTELMIWLNHEGVEPADWGLVVVDDAIYELWTQRINTWHYVGLAFKAPVQKARIPLGDILRDLEKRGLVNASDWVADIEFGNEVMCGKGQTVIKNFRVEP